MSVFIGSFGTVSSRRSGFRIRYWPWNSGGERPRSHQVVNLKTSGKIMTNMIIGAALIEALTIYALVVFFIVLDRMV